MSNKEVAKLLNNIATAYSIKNESKFRFQIIAYQKAAESIAGLNGEISEYFKEGSLELLPGVGPTIRSHLEELFKKGKVKHFDWVLKGIPKSVFVLTDIPSFGPKKAFRLAMEFNLKKENTVIEDLLKIAKKGKISVLEGFGEKSEKDIIRAIEEYKAGKGKTTRMILPYAFEISEKIKQYLLKERTIEKVEALGSLRRRVSTIGDIDFAVATDNPKAAIEHFVSYPYKERIIEKGDISASLMVSGGKQIDLLIQPKAAFGSLLQHFTGSKNHNVHLREYALSKGLSLSEKGIKSLKKQGELKQYSTEEEFYNAMGMQWIPPEMREDTGEIELSIAGKIPTLIKPEDLRGDFHIHSSYPIEPSHDAGKNSPEEMLEKASELGYEYLAFSEHNPSISRHTSRQIYEILVKRDKYLEQLKSKTKSVRVFKMLEVDILPSGKLSLLDDHMDILDGAIVSVHSSFNMTKEAMTERVLKALSHKKAKILAHPTGRLLGNRNGYDLDFEKVFEFCKKNNKALEINAWPQRLYLPDTIVKDAVLKGVKMVIDSDSHAKDQMDLIKYGVFVARRGWATKNDIINTMSYNQVKDWIKK